MTLSYHGEPTPRSIPFMVTVKNNNNSDKVYGKGDIIKINDVDHVINSIKKVEFKGDSVRIIGKCKVCN